MADSKTSEEEARQYADSIINTIHEPLIVLNHDLRVISASRSFYDVFKVKPEETLGQLIYDLGHNQWNILELRQLLETILPLKTTLEFYEVENEFADIGKRIMLFNAREIQRKSGKERLILLAIEDITERRRLENLLSESEERYRRLFETANDGIVLLEKAEGKITHANPAITEMLGHSHDELIGKDLIHIGFPDDIGIIQEILQTLEKNGILHYKNVPVQTKTRQVVDTDIYMVDKTKLVQCNIRNITDRKQMEEDLRESEKRYRLLVEAANDLVWIFDLSSMSFTYCSKSVETILGYSQEEVKNFKLDDIFPPKTKKKVADVLDKTLKGEINSDKVFIEAEHRHKDGSLVWMEISAVLHRDNLGQPLSVTGISRDITKRRHAEAKHAEQNALIEAIYCNAPLIMMVVDTDRRIQQVNGFATQFAGRPAEEMLGLRGGEALHCLHVLDDQQGCGFGEFCNNCIIRNTVLDTLESGTPHQQVEASFDFSFEDKARSLTLLISTTPLIFNEENMTLLTMMDITEHRQSEQEREKLQSQLLQAQKLESVGRLAGGVAHDFNNMLSIINGYAEMSFDMLDPEEPVYKNLKEIHSAGTRSANIVRQLLAFARKQSIRPLRVDLNQAISDMLKMLQRLIGENIDLTWHPGKNLWQIEIDPSQLDQIMANLVVNARDAIEDVGKLIIETKNVVVDADHSRQYSYFVPGRYVMLAVSDTGCGMEKEVQDNLFEPFFTTKGTGKGTGLGLSTVYGIVKQNNGFINVYSEPGQGTTFKIYLPRHAEKAAALDREGREQYPLGNGETILVLEDEISVLNLAKTMLERLGYKALASNSVHEALALIKSRDGAIDLLITDLVMPEMNGRDFANQVNTLYPDVKTLFMSGYTADVIVRHGILQEGVHYIQKPFSIKDLAVKVRKVIENE